MTKEELDERLFLLTTPAPVILVGPHHPITTFQGYNDPYTGWYRGIRVITDPTMGENIRVEERTGS